jgi:hypothetical protein
MPKLTVVVTAAIGITAIALLFPTQVLNATVLSNQGSIAQIAREMRPIEKAAVCYGVGWRGFGYYPSILGLRPACWDTLPSGGPVYPVPAYDPGAATHYYCDHPRGYFPAVEACASGWRLVSVTR